MGLDSETIETMPETESKTQYLEQLIVEQLSSTSTDAKWYRRWYFFFQNGLVVIGATITITAGVKFNGAWTTGYSKGNILVFLGALSSVWAAIGGFYSPQQTWHENVMANNKLRALQAKLKLSEFEPDFAEKKEKIVDHYFAEFQKILDERNSNWLKTRESTKSDKI
jgi:hypothetical protein